MFNKVTKIFDFQYLVLLVNVHVLLPNVCHNIRNLCKCTLKMSIFPVWMYSSDWNLKWKKQPIIRLSQRALFARFHCPETSRCVPPCPRTPLNNAQYSGTKFFSLPDTDFSLCILSGVECESLHEITKAERR